MQSDPIHVISPSPPLDLDSGKQLDLVSLGECMIEFAEASDHTFALGCAGDVFNTLFYASRLGLRCGFLSQIGCDPFQHVIERILEKERIDSSCTIRSNSNPNGIYFILRDEAGAAQFHFRRSDAAARETLIDLTPEQILAYIRTSRAFHFSAIGLAILKERPRIFPILDSLPDSTLICFDTNVRRTLWQDLGELRALIEQLHAHILFVTDTDDEALYGKRSPTDAIEHYHSLGYKEVILRTGAEGCWVSDGNVTHVPAIRGVKVVDTTGAGDAFNAGYIQHRLHGSDVVASAQFACAVAACAIQERGGIAQGFDPRQAEEYFGLYTS